VVGVDTWNLRGTAVAVGVAAVIAGVGGAAVYAATDDGPRMMGMHTGGGMPFGDRDGSPHDGATNNDATHNDATRATARDSASLHGEYVVANGAGGFETKISQTGRVTAISATSVTARSDDGYSQTYVISTAGAAGIRPFHVGDEVTIDATRTGQTATVVGIGEPSVAQKGQGRPG
jgi:hypothetical protein